MNMGRGYWAANPTGRFGDDRGGGRKHRGVDMSHSTRAGTVEVPALLGGTVVGILAPASWHGFGHQVTIRTSLGGNPWDFSYGHGSQRTPAAMGQNIAQFQSILLEGTTGATSGSCVHVEQQRVGGGFIDPLPEIRRVAAASGGGGAPAAGGGIPYNEHDFWVQGMLNQLGYNLVRDGKRGTGTIAAIKDFQGKRGLVKDGIPGPKTTEALNAALAKPATGSPGGLNFLKGWDWVGVQKMLSRVYGYGGPIDNDPGDGTWKAMQKFLRNYGYNGDIDGKPGNGTLSAVARWLRAKWGYVGNDQPGPVMQAAFARASQANAVAYR